MPRISTGGEQTGMVQAYTVWLSKHSIQTEKTPVEESEPEEKLPQST